MIKEGYRINHPRPSSDFELKAAGRGGAGTRAGARELENDRAVRRGLGARIFYAFSTLLSQIAGILIFDIRPFGASRIPRRGAAVVASNHQSYLDSWLVGMCIQRGAYYLARDSLFRFPIFSSLLRSVNALPIPRGTASSRRGIDLGRAVLRARKVVVLFPEGTRSRDGTMSPLKRGIDLITRPSGAPVVPVYIDGSYEAWPPQNPAPRFHPVRVFFGAPVRGGCEGGGPEEGRSEDGVCADLLERLSASYRSLEAKAREVCRAGVPALSGRPHFS